jgi:hypothetical protein
MMKHRGLVIAVIVLYLLHQDFWFWRSAEPIVFGFLPVGLFYHICFTLAVALLMLALVKWAWPTELESEPGDDQP